MGQREPFGMVIRTRLEDARISQRQASERTGIPLATLNRRITGGAPFDMEQLGLLAKLLGVPVSRLAIEAEAADRGAA